MPAKKPVKKEKKEFDVREWNRGFTPKPVKVGQKVTVYKIPYREVFKIGTGRVERVIYHGEFMVYADVVMEGSESAVGHWVYIGKVYQGQNPNK